MSWWRIKVSNETRVDNADNWANIENEVLNAYNGEYSEFRAIEKELQASDELLFEAYSSHRPVDIHISVFERYIREYISAKILCGKSIEISNNIHLEAQNKLKEPFAFERFFISDLIYKLEKGKDRSIDRRIENKYDNNGFPLVIAKKDNNGIGGLKEDPVQIYKDKICIICGGDGGGKTYYLEYDFCATNFVMICSFANELQNISKYAKFYISVVISERLFKTIGHGRTIKDVPQETTIKLPAKSNGKLDIEYMENFIKQFEIAKYM